MCAGSVTHATVIHTEKHTNRGNLMCTYPRIIALFIVSVIVPWAMFGLLIGPEFGTFMAGLMAIANLVSLPARLSDRKWHLRLDKLGR